MAMLAPRRAAPELPVLERVRLGDGAETSLQLVVRPLAEVAVRVVRLPRPVPLVAWCARRGVEDAIVGGFFTRPGNIPLGELRTRGIVRRSVSFLARGTASAAACTSRGGG